jgi:hypothetical protein
MFRKLMRFLRIVDEILEVLVLKLFLGGIRRRPLRAILLAALMVGAWQWAHRVPVAPPAPTPVPAVSAPASAPDDIQNMLDIDLALNAEVLPDEGDDIAIPPIDFSALRTDIWSNTAVIRYGGQEYTVAPGQLVPNANGPHFVITSIQEHHVEAFDWGSKQVVRKITLAPPVFGGTQGDLLDI